MLQCPSCQAEVAPESKFCSTCGGAVESKDSIAETMDVARQRAPSPSSAPSGSHHGRFLPGTSIGGRYRIVSLLGKGGMGEVYRADDMKLGHTVALKFLPASFCHDPRRLEFFLNEVRLSRQVSHPNVCRVYDVGEIDGNHYLSMEYIDGEDLRVLLRRIGHLPEDKGIEIAQQLCAGLGAAHAKGVLHRDLKPANVMIDGQGQVRITDFGLARLSSEEGDREIVGTPAYMAPEQLQRGETSSASDIYSLGLILSEIFTGKQVYKTNSPQELRKLHQESSTSLSQTATGLDPAVEKVILRCLHTAPQQRPASAQSVAGALPGADPLAAALAAGETPSPELVAASGDQHGLEPRAALAILAAAILLTLALMPLRRMTSFIGWAQPSVTPQELRGKSRELIGQLGYVDEPVDEADGFAPRPKFAEYVSEEYDAERFADDWANGRLHSLFYWYRSSPTHLIAETWRFRFGVDPETPAANVPGMISVMLDQRGQLLRFHAVPKVIDSRKASEETETEPVESDDVADSEVGDRAQVETQLWPEMFAAAGLDWQPPDSESNADWIPPDYADRVSSWSSIAVPGDPRLKVDVHAASLKGKPTFFRVVPPWSPSDRPSEPERTAFVAIAFCLYVIILSLAVVIAYRNVRLNRGDRRVAKRLARIMFVLSMIWWAVETNHVPTFDEVDLAFAGIAYGLLDAALIAVCYLALEPYARRIWPSLLISWSRLHEGQWNNPHIGRDVLIGTAAGQLVAVLGFLSLTVPYWFGLEPPGILSGNAQPSTDGYIVFVCEIIQSALWVPLTFFLFFLLLLRTVLRNDQLAIVVFWLFTAGVFASVFGGGVAAWIAMLIGHGVLTLVVIRYGLLAASVFVFSRGLAYFPATDDPASWYFAYGVTNAVIMISLALYGFYVSTVGRSLFNDAILGEAQQGRAMNE